MTAVRRVAILIFDEVEVLDFAGPFEVFGVTGKAVGEKPFEVFTVAERREPVSAVNGLSINPACSIDDCPVPHILLIPGGYGTRRQLTNDRLLGWIRAMNAQTELTLSVCTGALLLGKAGLLDGLQATTYHTTFDLLGELAPTATLCPSHRFVDNGHIITSAGISAGIDMSFYVVARLLGPEKALETARYMEYDLNLEYLSGGVSSD